jgi:hypothetical protein
LLQYGATRRRRADVVVRDRDECGYRWYLYPAVNGKAAGKVSDGFCGCLALGGGIDMSRRGGKIARPIVSRVSE